MSYGRNKKDHDLLNQLYLDDTDDGYNHFKMSTSSILKKRRELLHTAKLSTGRFCIPLNIDCFQTPCYLMPGINIKIRIHKAKEEFFMITDNVNVKLKITDLNMKFRLVQVKESFVGEAKKIANGSNIGYYPFYQTKIRTNLITKNLSTFTWSNCVKGRLPEQLIVCMVKHASYVGSWKNNPYAFEPFDLNNIFLRINGSPYPVKSYNPDFTAGAFVILVKTCAICLYFLKLSYK